VRATWFQLILKADRRWKASIPSTRKSIEFDS
jgi:hypothetical protein